MSSLAPRLIVTACSRVDTPWERRANSLTCRCLRPNSASNLLFWWGARLLRPVEKTRGANCLRKRRERQDNSFSCMLEFCVTLGFQKEQSPSLLLINIAYITIRYLLWTKRHGCSIIAFCALEKEKNTNVSSDNATDCPVLGYQSTNTTCILIWTINALPIVVAY